MTRLINLFTHELYLAAKLAAYQLAKQRSLFDGHLSALQKRSIDGAHIDLQNLVGWCPLNCNASSYSGNNNGVPTSGVSYTSNWYSGYSEP